MSNARKSADARCAASSGCRSTKRPAEAGIAASVGSRGDAHDNALAESVIGLFKTEVIWPQGPWRGLDSVEFATLEWVWWFNHQRLLEPSDIFPSWIMKHSLHALTSHQWRCEHSNRQVSGKPGAVQ